MNGKEEDYIETMRRMNRHDRRKIWKKDYSITMTFIEYTSWINNYVRRDTETN